MSGQAIMFPRASLSCCREPVFSPLLSDRLFAGLRASTSCLEQGAPEQTREKMTSLEIPASRHPAYTALLVILVGTVLSPAASLVPLSGVPRASPYQMGSFCGGASCKQQEARAGPTLPVRSGNGPSLQMSGQPGDNNGGLGGSPEYVDVFGNSIGPMCPEAVSNFKLRILLLHMNLKVALRQERYHRASRIKRQISNLRSQDIEVLVGKLLNVSRVMKEDLARKRQDDPITRIEHELETAVAEQNFTQAGLLRDELKKQATAEESTPVARVVNGSKSAILHHIDVAWLESEITTRVNVMRTNLDATLRDPVVRLEYELGLALEGEDYFQAAKITKELNDHLHRRSVRAMMDELQRSLKSHKTQLKEMRKDPERRLRYLLSNALNAEQYEDAVELRDQLSKYEAQRMHKTLEIKVREAKSKGDHAIGTPIESLEHKDHTSADPSADSMSLEHWHAQVFCLLLMHSCALSLVGVSVQAVVRHHRLVMTNLIKIFLLDLSHLVCCVRATIALVSLVVSCSLGPLHECDRKAAYCLLAGIALLALLARMRGGDLMMLCACC
jgi:protein-arginine kinase activator protein McsA